MNRSAGPAASLMFAVSAGGCVSVGVGSQRPTAKLASFDPNPVLRTIPARVCHRTPVTGGLASEPRDPHVAWLGTFDGKRLEVVCPERFGSLDVLVRQLNGYLQAGIRASRPGSGVTIRVPDGAARAQEVHPFVTVVGGATDVSSGTQMRIVVRRDANGWWLDPHQEEISLIGS